MKEKFIKPLFRFITRLPWGLACISVFGLIIGMYLDEDDSWDLRDGKFELFDLVALLGLILISIFGHLYNNYLIKKNMSKIFVLFLLVK